MNHTAMKGEASASANVLPFPQRNKGRIRKTQSLAAAGELTLNHLARTGIAEPANIARIRALPEPTPIERSPTLLLAITIWSAVPADQRDKLRSQIRYMASAEQCPHALALCSLLEERS